MTRALLLSFSPHGKAAQTFRLARALLREQAPEAEVVERDYGGQGLPALTREYANALTTPGGLSGPATERSEQLIVELEACDLLIICTPVHNFTVLDEIHRVNAHGSKDRLQVGREEVGLAVFSRTAGADQYKGAPVLEQADLGMHFSQDLGQ